MKHGNLLSAFEVAAACLRYATLATAGGHVFDSGARRSLDVYAELHSRVGSLSSGFDPDDLDAIADSIAASSDPPLAAWITADLISVAVSGDFTTQTRMPTRYELEDLQPFPTAANGCAAVYGGTSGLSARPGSERHQNQPFRVDGLSLWRHDRAHPFVVTVDTDGGSQLSASLDEEGSLKVALVQPNQDFSELCVTTLSNADDDDHRFFGVRPRDEAAQTKLAVAGLKAAAAAEASVALLPELVMTEDIAEHLARRLAAPGKLIPKRSHITAMRAVISGSFHHVDAEGIQRNSIRIHFPRSTEPEKHRQHSKSGDYFLKSARLRLEALSCDTATAEAATSTLHDLGDEKAAALPVLNFREDVKPTHKITLFSGARFSATVAICSDLLNATFRDTLRALIPTVLFVSTMTEKQGEFFGAAHELIGDCQTTMITVNNPARHGSGPVPGALVGMPLRDGSSRIAEEHFDVEDELIVVDLRTRQLRRWRHGEAVDH